MKKNDTHCSKNRGNWKRENAYDNGEGKKWEMKDWEEKEEEIYI